MIKRAGNPANLLATLLAGSSLLFSLGARAALFKEPVTLNSVEAELESMKMSHPWAGSYSGPGGLSVGFINIAPSGKYCVAMTYDMGPTTVSKCGRLLFQNGRLVTDGVPRPWEREDRDGPPYFLSQWGGRRYLVPERRMLDFVNAVNSVQEPRMGRLFSGSLAAFLRAGDGKILVGGMPDLPQPYRALLRPRNIFATAVSVSTRTNIITRIGSYEDEDCGAEALFDFGASSGAFVGMTLHAQGGDLMASVALATVTAGSSSGRIKQYDCDKTDPLPAGTRFATRPLWRANVVLSTDSVTAAIQRVSKKKEAPFFEGRPFDFYQDESFAGAAKEGFQITEIARLTFTSAVPGALHTDDAEALRTRTVLSLGGNAVAVSLHDRPDGKDKAGGIETLAFPVYRVSYKGQALDPRSAFWRALERRSGLRGEKTSYDWRQARSAGIPAAFCGDAGREAERASVLSALHWDEATLSRAHELKFRDLTPEQRAAVETLVPEDRRDGYVWPPLQDVHVKVWAEAAARAREAQKDYDTAHPAEAAACKLAESEVDRIFFRP